MADGWRIRHCRETRRAGGLDGGKPVPWEGDRLLDSPDLVIGHWQQAWLRGAALQPLCGVGEDQAVLLGEPEQRPDRRDRGVDLVTSELVQPGPDVVGGDLLDMVAVG